ncbi:hypothetical protein H8E77_30575 [bacterium]|nr:hypothetical protein [bacterium]
MKNIIATGLIFTILIAFTEVSPAKSETASRRVVILYFDDHSRFDSPTGCGCIPNPVGLLFGTGRKYTKWNLKTGFRDLLNVQLMESQVYEPVHPDDLAIAFAELEIKKRDLKYESKRAALADKLNLDAMLIGDIRKFNQERVRGSASRIIRDGGQNFGGVGGIQASGYYYRASVHIKLRIYDATGREIAISEIKESSTYELGGIKATPFTAIASSTGTKVKVGTTTVTEARQPDPIVHRDKLDQIDFGSLEYQKTLFGIASGKALNEIILKLRQRIGPELLPEEEIKQASQPDSAVTLKGIVASVIENPPQVYINLGSKHGIEVGGKLTVYEQGKEITDPETGELLGYEDDKVGLVEIIDVMSPTLSKANILEGAANIKRGDAVKGNK